MRSKPYPMIGKLIDAFGNWLERSREVREMRELEPSEFTAIARELSITPEDLDTFVHNGPKAVDELPKLLKVLGIDETGTRAQPAPCATRHGARLRRMPTKASVQPRPQRRYHRRKFRAVLPQCVDDRRIG